RNPERIGLSASRRRVQKPVFAFQKRSPRLLLERKSFPALGGEPVFGVFKKFFSVHIWACRRTGSVISHSTFRSPSRCALQSFLGKHPGTGFPRSKKDFRCHRSRGVG